jgi:hypothetical protein
MFIQKVHRLLIKSTLVLSDLLHSNHIQLATCSLVTAFYELDLQTPDTSSSKSHVLLLLLITLFLSYPLSIVREYLIDISSAGVWGGVLVKALRY